MPVTTGKTTTQPASSSRPSGGPGGGALSAPVRTAPSVSRDPGSSPSRPSTTTRAPAASAAAAKASAAKSTTGSGQIGSKGGGASVQQPGSRALSGPGIVSANRNTFNQKANAATGRIDVSRATSVPTPPPAPKPPQGAKVVRPSGTSTAFGGPPNGIRPAKPQAPGYPQGIYGPHDVNQSFSDAWREKTLTGRALNALVGGSTAPQKPGVNPNKYSAPVGPQRPRNVVAPGGSYTNPKGVPESVAKALAARGLNPDGSRMQGGITPNKYSRPIGPNRPIAQDPSLKGRAALADKNYKPATGPGGMVGGMVYDDPDLRRAPQSAKVARPSGTATPWGGPAVAGIPQDPSLAGRLVEADKNYRTVVGAGLGGGVQRQYVDPDVAQPRTLNQIVSDAVSGAWNRISNNGEVRPGALRENAPAIEDTRMNYDEPYYASGSLMGQPNFARELTRAVVGENAPTYPRDNLNKVPPNMMRTTPDQYRVSRLVSDPTNLSPAGSTSVSNIQQAALSMAPRAPKLLDRVPQTRNMPAPTGEESVTFPRAPGPPRPQARPLDLVTRPQAPAYPGGDGITGADIGGVFDNGTRIEPMGALASSPDMVTDNMGMVQFSNLASPQRGRTLVGNDVTDPGLSRFGSIGSRSIDSLGNPARQGRTRSLSTPASDTQDNTVGPSQQGENVPPSQVDRRPTTVREVLNQYRYERDRAKENFKQLPSRIGRAILDGDIRNPLGRGNFPNDLATRDANRMTSTPAPAPSNSYAQLIAQLLQALEQQQGQGITSGSQASLVNSTFR